MASKEKVMMKTWKRSKRLILSVISIIISSVWDNNKNECVARSWTLRKSSKWQSLKAFKQSLLHCLKNQLLWIADNCKEDTSRNGGHVEIEIITKFKVYFYISVWVHFSIKDWHQKGLWKKVALWSKNLILP